MFVNIFAGFINKQNNNSSIFYNVRIITDNSNIYVFKFTLFIVTDNNGISKSWTSKLELKPQKEHIRNAPFLVSSKGSKTTDWKNWKADWAIWKKGVVCDKVMGGGNTEGV